MKRLEKNDITFAHLTISLYPGLSGNAKRVAAAIVDHFNRRTGQCDPSIGRLSKLLDISRASIVRATTEIAELRLILKVSHGGCSHRAAYTPNWILFRSFVRRWNEQMIREGKCSEMSTSTEQDRALDVLRNEQQTDSINRPKEPAEANLKGKRPRQRCDGLRKEDASPSLQGFIIHSMPGGKSTSRGVAAKESAKRQILDSARKRAPGLAFRIDVEATAAMLEAAAEAEMAHRGSGLRHLLEAIDARKSA